MSVHSKDLQTPGDCLLVKAHIFGLITDPRALWSADDFLSSSPCSVCSVIFALVTMSLKLGVFLFVWGLLFGFLVVVVVFVFFFNLMHGSFHFSLHFSFQNTV